MFMLFMLLCWFFIFTVILNFEKKNEFFKILKLFDVILLFTLKICISPNSVKKIFFMHYSIKG